MFSILCHVDMLKAWSLCGFACQAACCLEDVWKDSDVGGHYYLGCQEVPTPRPTFFK